jgi:hypothetical protein
MSTTLWLSAVAHQVSELLTSGGPSPANPVCDVSELSRLLWTAIAVAGAAGLLGVVRPSWQWVAGLTGAGLVWLWIDMEGPVLVARGTHGVHLADIPVAITLAAAALAAARLLLWRRTRSDPDQHPRSQ